MGVNVGGSLAGREAPDDSWRPTLPLYDVGMRSERARLGTFREWPPTAPIGATELASAGFYFLGPGDKVQCFCCGGVLRHWAPGDSALGEHRRHFPTCPLMLGVDVGNIAMPSVSASRSDAVDGQLLSQLQGMTVEDQAAVGQAVYPQMEAEEARMNTFHSWPSGASVLPETLVRAGFFYTGYGDNVKCFYCDGGLRNWEDGDDPWQEHAKWFPRCGFLLQRRGREYVSNIQHSYFHTGEIVGVSQLPALTSSSSAQDLVADVLQAEEEERQNPSQTREDVVRREPGTGEERPQTHTSETVGNLSPEEQLRRLQEERTCKVCMDKQVSMVFIPCGHLVVCMDCASSLRHCPICRAVIRGSVRAFMS